MDDRCLELAEDFVSARYIAAGHESLHSTARTLRCILAQRRCPDEGISDAAIQLLLRQMAMMDTNNFAAHVGGGEREGRVVSSLVRQRHYHFTHGIGRSGDLVAEQPKAAGSSLLYKLVNVLLLDLIRLAGAPSTQAAVVVPMATGMTLALVLRCVAKARVKELAHQKFEDEKGEATATAPSSPPVVPRYVVWPRIDQKTALKCIDAAGLTAVPVLLRPAPPVHPSSSTAAAATAVSTDALFLECAVDDIAAAVDSVGGPAHVVCVLSTTSCFAPRLPDNTVAIAQYCKLRNIPYVVNNAYGVQSRRIMTRLDAAQRLGRLDYFVQSGDKNFLVPVGGSIVCSASVERCHAAAALYAGRASASPVIDLFITALSLGRRGMQALWEERYACRRHLVEQLRVFARERGELLLVDDDGHNGDGAEDATPDAGVSPSPPEANGAAAHRGKKRAAALSRNDISVAVTMRRFGRAATPTPAAAGMGGDARRTTDAVAAVDDGAAPPPNWAAARALGAQLFRSAVTGPRVVVPAPTTATTIAGCTFYNYGMHQEGVPAFPLLVIACGIGMTMGEVDALMYRLREVWPTCKETERCEG
jgi:O-phospho-L-seryl-tRNASec:L-selenocysteinyl-tRNA synthase